MFAALREFFRSTDGSGSVKAIVWLPVFFAVSGLSVDAARGYATRTNLQTAADAAAHAAVFELPDLDQARDVAKSYAARNAGQAVVQDEDVLFGNWDADTRTFTQDAEPINSVRVITRRSRATNNPLPTTFLALVGQDSWDVSTQATATRNFQLPIELALVLDGTNSMQISNSAESARQRLFAALQQLEDHQEQEADLHVSFIPFTDRVNIGASKASWLSSSPPSDWNGCVMPREEPEIGFPHALTDAPPDALAFQYSADDTEPVRLAGMSRTIKCHNEIVAPTTDLSLIEDSLNAMFNIGTGRFDAALAWGWRAVSPRWSGVWGISDYPKQSGDARKAVIYIADGRASVNNSMAMGGMGEHNQVPMSLTYNRMSQGHADHLVEICRKMQAQDIMLFMIAPEVADQRMENAMASCAAADEHSLYFQVGDDEGLENALDAIIGSLLAFAIVE